METVQPRGEITMKLAKSLGVFAAAVALAACSTGGVKRDESLGKLANPKVASVKAHFSEEAKMVDNKAFNVISLRDEVSKQLLAKGLIDARSGQHMEVEVTHVYFRSTGAAVMLGAMAGNDEVMGNVYVKGPGGKLLSKLEVVVSSPSGGYFAQAGNRLQGMYALFAARVVKGLTE
jgi:hypothetical protein